MKKKTVKTKILWGKSARKTGLLLGSVVALGLGGCMAEDDPAPKAGSPAMERKGSENETQAGGGKNNLWLLTAPGKNAPEVQAKNGAPGAKSLAAHFGQGEQRNRASVAAKIAALQSTTGREKLAAVMELWVHAADAAVPSEALQALSEATYDQNPLVANKAKQALADLERHLERAENGKPPAVAESSVMERNARDDGEPTAETDGRNFPSEAPEVTVPADVAERASRETDDTLRGEAIHTVSLMRGDAASEVLLATSEDGDAANRFRSIRALWASAADGHGLDGRVRQALELALTDSHPRNAALARRALDDLERLASRRSR